MASVIFVSARAAYLRGAPEAKLGDEMAAMLDLMTLAEEIATVPPFD
ncbi:MAG: hypothetical protein KDE49_00015 [Novosphingobium sp.]|nr:hypothetical protein [Novosphingobium sp.]